MTIGAALILLALAAPAAAQVQSPEPAPSEVEGPAPSEVEGPAPSEVEGPAPSGVEGRIAEIRVHGNHTTPDADVLAIAGLQVGEAATAERLADAEAKLRASRRFTSIEVRRRYRSIADPSEILIVLLVDELPGISAGNLVPGPLGRLRASTMWLPILDFDDGYGFTYGARLSLVHILGDRGRISTPLTWGGDRRAAVEVERAFDRGPLSLLRGTVAIDRRVNPHFDVADTRREVIVQADRALRSWLRVGGDARVTQVAFGPADARHQAAGGHVVLDTRLDPSFPRNGVLASTAWERVAFEGGSASRWSTEFRGYLGVYRGTVLAVRARTVRAGSALPSSEQTLAGGSESLRGYRAGYLAGDGIAVTSTELRIPLTSPLNVGRFGAKVFVDAGTAWPAGTPLAKQHFERGTGAGIYFGAAALSAGVDVAWPHVRPGGGAQAPAGARWSFGLGLSF